MFKNLVMMFPSLCMSSLPQALYTKFIEHLQKLTCAFGREAALEEEVCLELVTEVVFIKCFLFLNGGRCCSWISSQDK